MNPKILTIIAGTILSVASQILINRGIQPTLPIPPEV